MTQPVQPRETVDAPTVTPWPYGLATAATVLEPPGERWALGGVQYESDNCGAVSPWDGRCVNLWGFGITLTATATPGTFVLAVVEMTEYDGAYEYRVGDGAWTAVPGNDQIPVTGAAPVRVCVRRAAEPDAVLACVDVDPAAAESTVYTADAAPPDKVANNSNLITEGDPFALYALMDCPAPGMVDRIEPRTTARFLAGEQYGIERVFDRGLVGNLPFLGMPDVETPLGTTAVPPKQALGELDHIAAQRYRGRATIHAPRWTNTYFADRMATLRVGPQLEDTVGNKWAFGAGYSGIGPDGTTPPDGQAWLYATGEVTIRRSALFTPATVSGGGFDPRTNALFVLVERRYVITVDCFAIAVLVTMAGEE